ncbi:hypothetical protein FACS189455_2840 [Bacteroidia bacterium]|nr:hypothetical protein FACS189455_2840 [Bacteroidia bacterium]
MLSDIRKDQPFITESDTINKEEADTIVTELPVSPLVLSDWPENTVGFEDFSPEQNGMDAFFKAIASKSPVRIAFFGDSFIEGDIFCGDLRELLQKAYGGKGVGMIPMSSAVSGFRRTVSHQYYGWKDFSLTDTSQTPPLGISGHAFIPKGDETWSSYSLPKKKDESDSCMQVSLFYTLQTGYESHVNYNINRNTSQSISLKASGQVERLNIRDNRIGSIRFSFPDTAGLTIYGVSLEDTTGIIVDNFSIRGTAGTAFGKISSSALKRFDQLMGYDLIILEYGLNAMEGEKTGYKWYGNAMAKTIQYLQNCFPNASFLLLSVSDRSMKKDGEYITMPAVNSFVTSQRRACSETGIVFWNLFRAMGGEGSMIEWANANPPKANKDYTHLTFIGGRWLAKKLFDTFEFENKRYHEKREYFEKAPHKNTVHDTSADSIVTPEIQ